jgi:cob(I)alamin adenosyltransferase
MVYLHRIYTKTGDKGETALGDGTRVMKTHPRIAAYGGVDELNSVLGFVIAQGVPTEMVGLLTHIQNDLFDIGADLCLPETETPPPYPPLRVTEEQVEQLEQWIDRFNEPLSPLNSFVLPGGSMAAATLHLARTACRRVELGVLHLAATEPINPQIAIYLNRLSDLLFVLSRVANNNGKDDVLWTPGKHRSPPQ